MLFLSRQEEPATECSFLRMLFWDQKGWKILSMPQNPLSCERVSFVGVFCSYLTDRISHMNLWISSVILLLYKLSETLLCCISCVWWISVWNKANHFSFVLSMDATMKADIKPLKSFLWITVSKCFAIYQPK